MTNQTNVEAFWQAYLDSLPAGTAPPSPEYESWHFGDNEAMAAELGDLVCRGIKTATTGLLWEYEAEGEDLPQVGALSIITTFEGEPLCIIETTEVEIKPFNEVDEQFAYDEGEGDRSLAYWRQGHWSFFAKYCQSLGQEPRQDMPVVCERFRVVFPPLTTTPQ